MCPERDLQQPERKRERERERNIIKPLGTDADARTVIHLEGRRARRGENNAVPLTLSVTPVKTFGSK